MNDVVTASADVEGVLAELGIEITGRSRSGADGHIEYQARCPHHHDGTKQEHTPSWGINAETGQHYCHSCGFSGSLEWLIHKVSGVPMPEATKRVDRPGRALRRVRSLDPWAGERHVPVPTMNEARIKMHGEPPAWALQKRRLTAEVARMYEVRWADHFTRTINDKIVTHDNCWITPIRHAQTNVAIGMQVKQEGGERFFRNLPGGVPKSTTVFGLELLHPDDVAVVVESPLDAAYVRTLGFPGVATFGAAVSDEQMGLLITRCSGLLLALDDDKAGWKMTYRLLGMWPSGRPNRHCVDYSKRIPIWVANYGEAMGAKDPGEMVPSVARSVLTQTCSALRFQMGLMA